MTKIFVAGATGAVGKCVVENLKEKKIEFIAHLRPKPGREEHELFKSGNAAYYELSDTDKISESMKGCSSVMQLIGTIRKRFDSGDTYETSDIETTRQLVLAAKKAGVKNLVILSSVGAGNPTGSYLKAKQKAEGIVISSGLNYSLVRPSAFMGDRHKLPPGTSGFMNFIGAIGFKSFASKYKPIDIQVLSEILVSRALEPLLSNEILEGESLWEKSKS